MAHAKTNDRLIDFMQGDEAQRVIDGAPVDRANQSDQIVGRRLAQVLEQRHQLREHRAVRPVERFREVVGMPAAIP